MDKVFFITPENFNTIEGKNFDRLYFGCEFCEKLLPDEEFLEKITNYSNSSKISLSFVTPYVTNKGTELIKRLIYQINSLVESKIEIIFNDWGILNLFENTNNELVLGRILLRQLRDPRIIYKQNKIKNKQNISDICINEDFIQFLTEKKIRRIELDTIPSDISEISKKIKLSLYYPYTYITTTRLCPFANIIQRKKYVKYVIKNCNKECRKYAFRMISKKMPEKLILSGNTIYFWNKMTADIKSTYFDRIIYKELGY